MVLVKVWQFRKFTLTLFWQKFREINDFTKEITRDDLTKKKIFDESKLPHVTSQRFHEIFCQNDAKSRQFDEFFRKSCNLP